MKKAIKKKKKERLRNKKLIKQYPWLQPLDWYGRPIKHFDYSSTWLDDMEPGWCIAFGMMMVKEIDAILHKAHYEREYQVVQIKEKYGALRWYDNGAPHEIYDELQQVKDKNSYLSENICAHCGKPDVYMTFSGWDYPLCEECWNTHINDTRSYKDVISEKDTGRMTDSYTIRRSSKEGNKDITYDIHETAEEIRRQYARRSRR